MALKGGLVSDVAYTPARWIGGHITPEIVVLHDTASPLIKGSAADYLRDNEQKVSVHFVVERDGTVQQQVPVDKRANHAGRSVYHGRKGCNDFSIGIEIVNPGRMKRLSDTKALAWWGGHFDIAECDIVDMATPEHGHGLWMPYPAEQMRAVVKLLETLIQSVPSLQDITAHWYVSPGRKVDTNPLFPLDEVRAVIFGREDPAEGIALKDSDPSPAGQFVQIDTPGDTLNMRRWPSFNPNVIAALPDETVVPVLRAGAFDGRRWLLVRYGGREGWIVADHAAPIIQSLETGFKKEPTS